MRGRLLLVVAALAACYLPERDNLNDPALRPVARLSVVTLEGSRATDFVFDARASDDPLERGKITFTWELDDFRYDTLPEEEYEDFTTSTGTSGLLTHRFPSPFPDAYIDSNGEGTITRRVRVRVTTVDGAVDTAEGTIVLRNSRPIIDPGEDIFASGVLSDPIVLDVSGGGYDPTTIDPDGDGMRFTWTQLSGPPATLTALDTSGHRVSFVPPPPGQRRTMTFRVTGTDLMSGGTDFIRVHFGTQIWAVSRLPTRLYRVFPEFESHEAFTDSSGAVQFAPVSALALTDSGRIWTAERTSTTTAVVRRMSSDRLIASSTLVTVGMSGPPQFSGTPIYADAAGEDVCITMAGGEVVRVDSLGVPMVSGPIAARRVHGRPDGSCWVITGTDVLMLDAGGSFATVAPALGALTRSALDVDGDLWVVDAALAEQPRILRVTEIGTVEEIYAFGPSLQYSVTDLAPRPDGSMWLHDSNRQLSILTTAGVLTITDAPRVRLNPTLAVRQLAADPTENALWMADSQSGELVRVVDAVDTVREVGRLDISTVSPGAALFESPYLLADGSILATSGGSDPRLLRIPLHMRANERIDVDLISTFIAGIGGDPARGAVWVADGATYEQRFLRLTDRGRALAYVPQAGFGVAVRPDGGVVFSAFDAVTGANPRLEWRSPTGALERSVPTGGVAGAIDLVPSGLLCASRGDASGNAVIRLEPQSTQPEVLASVAFGDGSVTCAADRADGAVWTLSCDSSGALLRRFPSGSTTPSLTTSTILGSDIYCDALSIAPDPFEGAWIQTTGGTVRMTASGPVQLGTQMGAFERCPTGGICREVWVADLREIRRMEVDGTQTAIYPLPIPDLAFTVITAFDVVP